MEDRMTNILIALILIIVIGLAGIYFYKMSEGISNEVTVNSNQVLENEASDAVENISSTNTQNTNTTSINTSTENNQGQTIVIPSTNTTTQSSTNNSSENSDTVSTYEYNNKYYYNQLDSYSKVIYDAIANQIDNLKTGNYVINIDYDFASLLNQSNGQELLANYYDDAINAINLDIPNLFYIDFSKMYLNIETTTNILGTKYDLYIEAGDNYTYYSSGFSSSTQIESVISSIDSIKNQVCTISTGTEYNKIKTSHDWLIENLSYDSSATNKGNIYGAFIDKKAVCEGYARAYKYILDNLGITNILVTGVATNSSGVTEEHMWNYVKINGVWYAVDPTWDDPIVYGGGTVSDGTKHKYFLIGSEQLTKTHTVSSTISSSGKTFSHPTLSTTNY